MRRWPTDVFHWILVLLSGAAGAALGFIVVEAVVLVVLHFVYGPGQAEENPGIALVVVTIGALPALFTGFIGAAIAARWASRRSASARLSEGTPDRP